MYFFVIGEPYYTSSSWYKHMLSGILSEKRSKRFSTVILNSIDETNDFSASDDDVIFIIGSSLSWLESIIDVCEHRFGKNIIVLGNFERRLIGRSYSIVASDISKAVCNLYTYLTCYGKNKIAMYGINPKSASDDFRKNSFLECGGDSEDIYINNTNLNDCFDAFVSNINLYDAVLCANDYCAISMLQHLRDRNIQPPFVVSCGETKLAKIFKPSITNLKFDYSDFGKAGVNVYKMLQKDISVSSIQISLTSSIAPGDTTNNLAPLKSVLKTPALPIAADNSFYSDTEVNEMLKIENILNACDKTEFEILYCLINGMTYFDAAEKFHMSVNGIKYKLKKLFELCNINSKSELLELARKYMAY